MRRLFVASLVFGALMTGCAYDPTAACQNRCANAKADGCILSSTNCVTLCSNAESTYDSAREEASNRGCVSQYDTFIACYTSTPACATTDVINEMCAEEGLALQHCITP